MFMAPTINLRIKVPEAEIPLLHIESKVRAIEYNSST
jgi:hypothetical protein